MSRSRIVAIVVYFIMFILPFLILDDCGGRMSVMGCGASSDFAAAYADFYYNLAIGALFTFGLPVAVYAFIVVLFTEVVIRKLRTAI